MEKRRGLTAPFSVEDITGKAQDTNGNLFTVDDIKKAKENISAPIQRTWNGRLSYSGDQSAQPSGTIWNNNMPNFGNMGQQMSIGAVVNNTLDSLKKENQENAFNKTLNSFRNLNVWNGDDFFSKVNRGIYDKTLDMAQWAANVITPEGREYLENKKYNDTLEEEGRAPIYSGYVSAQKDRDGYADTLNAGAATGEYKKLELDKLNLRMTDEERETYKYLLGAGLKSDAEKYLKSVEYAIENRGKDDKLILSNALNYTLPAYQNAVSEVYDGFIEDILSKGLDAVEKSVNEQYEKKTASDRYFEESPKVIKELEDRATSAPDFYTRVTQGMDDAFFKARLGNSGDFYSQKQLMVLAYYVAIGDEEAEKEYNTRISYDINAKRAQAASAEQEEFAANNKALGFMASTASAPVKGLGGTVATIANNLDNLMAGKDGYVPLDPHDELFAMNDRDAAYLSGLTRDSNDIERFLWQTGISMGQSATTGIFGPAGLAMMAMNAGSDAAQQTAENGGTSFDALVNGAVSGGIEALTEKIPLERTWNILKTGSADSIARAAKNGGLRALANIGGQVLSEGTEELISEYANNIFDRAYNGANSEYWQYVDALTQNGYTIDEARNKADFQFNVVNPALSFAGGALSGGVMGSGATAVNKAVNGVKTAISTDHSLINSINDPQNAGYTEATNEGIFTRIGSELGTENTESDVVNRLKKEYNIDAGKLAHSDMANVMLELKNGREYTADELMKMPAVQEADKAAMVPKNGATMDLYPIGNPERDALRNNVAQRMLSDSENGAAVKGADGKYSYTGKVERGQTACIILGPPAAGKSTVFADPLSEKLHARIIDSDIAKTMLPEFENGAGANKVHKESAYISEMIALDEAMEKHENVVIPKVGNSRDNVLNIVKRLKGMGYTVNLYYNELSPQKAMNRSLGRFIENGRYITLDYLNSIDTEKIHTLFEELVQSGMIENYEWRNNDVPEGQQARLIEQGTVKNGIRTRNDDGKGNMGGHGQYRLDGVSDGKINKRRLYEAVAERGNSENGQTAERLNEFTQKLENIKGLSEYEQNVVRQAAEEIKAKAQSGEDITGDVEDIVEFLKDTEAEHALSDAISQDEAQAERSKAAGTFINSLFNMNAFPAEIQREIRNDANSLADKLAADEDCTTEIKNILEKYNYVMQNTPMSETEYYEYFDNMLGRLKSNVQMPSAPIKTDFKSVYDAANDLISTAEQSGYNANAAVEEFNAQTNPADIKDEQGRYLRPIIQGKSAKRQNRLANEFLENFINTNAITEQQQKELRADVWDLTERIKRGENYSEAASKLRETLFEGGIGVIDETGEYSGQFDEKIVELVENIEQIKRYKETLGEKEKFISAEEFTEICKEKERIENKIKRIDDARLTNKDKRIAERALKEGTEPSKSVENYNNIKAYYELIKQLKEVDKKIKEYSYSRRSALTAEAMDDVKNSESWKDIKALAIPFNEYSVQTPERNIRGTITDESEQQRIIDKYIKPVHIAAAKAKRMYMKIAHRVKSFNLNKYESQYVQLIGEKPQAEGEELEVINKNLEELKEHSDKINVEKCEKAVEEFRKIYDELFEKINEVYVKYGYAPLKYRKGYFPHIVKGGENIIDLFKDRGTKLPAEIAGKTANFKPGRAFNAHALQRMGFETEYDALRGIDEYAKMATDIITMTDSIQRLRALDRAIRYKQSSKGIQEQIEEVLNDDNLDEDTRQERIENLTGKEQKYHLNGLVQWLTEYTNMLANKTSAFDRTTEALFNRGIIRLGEKMGQRVAANLVAGNISTAMTNFIPIAQATGEVKGKYLRRAGIEVMKHKFDKAGISQENIETALNEAMKSTLSINEFDSKSTFLTSRLNDEKIYSSTGEKIGDVLSIPMNVVDSMTCRTVTYAKYLQNIDNGMTEQQAIDDADAFAASLIADRSKGALPTVFNAKNPIIKTLTMFQVETSNQIDYFFKDLPRKLKDKTKKEIIAAILKIILSSYFYNEVFEKMFGRRPAFDPLGVFNDVIGAATGYKLPNTFDIIIDGFKGEMPDFTTEKTGIIGAGKELISGALEQTPFIGSLLGGGRSPLAAAIPDWNKFTKVVEDDNGVKDTQLDFRNGIPELFKTVGAMLVMPAGGNQLKKTVTGLWDYAHGGDYSTTKDGPALKFEIEQNIPNFLRTAIAGTSATPEAQAYYNGDSSRSLSASKVEKVNESNTSINAYLTFKQKKSELGITGNSFEDVKQALYQCDLPKEDKYEILKIEKPNLPDEQNPYSDVFNAQLVGLSAARLEKAKELYAQGIPYTAYVQAYSAYNNKGLENKKYWIEQAAEQNGLSDEQKKLLYAAFGYSV